MKKRDLKKKKLSLALLLIFICSMALTFVACEKQELKEDFVGIVVDDLKNLESQSIKHDLEKTFMEMDVDYLTVDSKGNVLRQQRMIEGFLEKGVTHLVVIPTSYYGLEGSLEKAVEAGVQIIVLEEDVNMTEGIWKILPDKEGATKEIMERFSRELDGKSILEFQGDMGKNASKISTQLKKGLSKIHVENFKSVENVITRINGANEMLNLFNNEKLEFDFVFAHSEKIAIGVCDALFEMEEKEVQIIALGYNEDIRKSIFLGKTLCGVDFKRDYGKRVEKFLNNAQLDSKILGEIIYKSTVLEKA